MTDWSVDPLSSWYILAGGYAGFVVLCQHCLFRSFSPPVAEVIACGLDEIIVYCCLKNLKRIIPMSHDLISLLNIFAVSLRSPGSC